MTHVLVNPADPPARQHEKLLQIVEVLMRRVEQATDDSGAGYAQFQRAVMLEDQVRQRTRELEHALDLLNESNALLAEATREAESARQNLANAIETVQEGFALFDSDDVLVMSNSRFCMSLADVHGRIRPGLKFVHYVEMVSQSRFLWLPDGESPQTWAVRRLRRHSDRHVMFNVRLTGDRWLQVSEHRTRDGGTVILQTDVTDLIRLERQERGKLLDDQARIIRATLDHISQGVCIFDAERRLVGWNRRLAKLLTIPMNRLRLGTSFDTLLSGLGDQFWLGDGVKFRNLMDWVKTDGVRPPLSFELNRDDDLVLAAFAQGMPDRGFVMSFTDVTTERRAVRAITEANETLEQRVQERTIELAQALERAERANAARSRFVAAASHDLLQPLSAAKLFLASISDETLAEGAQVKLEKAQNALTSVESILDALLDISKLESGPAAVEVASVDLGGMLARLRDEFVPIAAQKGLTLRIIGSSGIVQSDPTYLRRILQNLISNAIRYTERGRILVGVRHVRGKLRIEVIDTGPGIPESEQRNIFREFHRLNARASASEGMGLGLAIVERACVLLNHPLELTSRLGSGTRFALTVPPATAPTRREVQPDPLDLMSDPQDSGRIVFLVENDAELRRAMCLLLEKWRLNVIDVDNAEEALSLLEEIGIVPDHFLVDYQMGDGMNGLELIQTLRKRYGDISARLITASRAPAMRKQCADAGIGMIPKPIDSGELAAFVLA